MKPWRVSGRSFVYSLLALNVCGACAQGVSQHVLSTPACVELNQRVLTQVANGQAAGADVTLAAALASGADVAQASCGGFVLNNMAALMAVSVRIAEAERLAERSFKILEKIYPPDDPVLLRPLQILAATRVEQGKIAKAREAYKRMQLIRIQSPEDSALVHGAAAPLLQVERRRGEAETEYLAAFQSWADAGQGETADAGAILNALGSLYIEEHRLDDARRMLDHALTIFSHATDAIPMDRIRLLLVRGVLYARQGEWQKAEQDLCDALSVADRQLKFDSFALRSLLSSYAVILRKNHRRKEARSIEARAAALGRNHTTEDVVDVTGLLAKLKRAAK
jgi:tetratricopeptide (TPR) repeat protein